MATRRGKLNLDIDVMDLLKEKKKETGISMSDLAKLSIVGTYKEGNKFFLKKKKNRGLKFELEVERLL